LRLIKPFVSKGNFWLALDFLLFAVGGKDMKRFRLQCIAGAALGTLLAGAAVQAQDTKSSDKTFV
jgi:hypothetical protein